MAWSWRFLDAGGGAVDPPGGKPREFPCQADAETWIGETWRSLVEQGVASVTLYEESRPVYGPMSLSVDW